MALDGIRVVCFGMGGAAPLATATLGDFGAEIFKIEPRTGDWSRTTPGLGTREFNRNKKSIAIDLKHPDGIALAKRMIATADVVMESFRPGVMKRLGLDYEAVRELNPRIVYCSVSAYGQTGPKAQPWLRSRATCASYTILAVSMQRLSPVASRSA